MDRLWMFGLGCMALLVTAAAAVELTERGSARVSPATGTERPAIAEADGFDATTSNLLLNRAWVQRMPRSTKDIVTWFIPLKMRGKQFGVAQRSSHFWFAGERFTWTGRGGTMNLSFQQSGRKLQLKARAYRCKKDGFDLCLDLSRKGRTVTLYSKKKWTVPRRSAEVPAFDLTPVTGTCGADCVDGVPFVLDDLL